MYSLVRYWKKEDEPDGGLLGFNPLTEDKAATKHVVEKISAMDSKLIDEIVTRIPDNYLKELQKRVVLANLKSRAQRIARIVGI